MDESVGAGAVTDVAVDRTDGPQGVGIGRGDGDGLAVEQNQTHYYNIAKLDNYLH